MANKKDTNINIKVNLDSKEALKGIENIKKSTSGISGSASGKQNSGAVKNQKDINKELKETRRLLEKANTAWSKTEWSSKDRKLIQQVSDRAFASGTYDLFSQFFSGRVAKSKQGSGIIKNLKKVTRIPLSAIPNVDLPLIGTNMPEATRSANELLSPFSKVFSKKATPFDLKGFTEMIESMNKMQKQALAVLASSYSRVFNTHRGKKALPMMDLAKAVKEAPMTTVLSMLGEARTGGVIKSQLYTKDDQLKKYFTSTSRTTGKKIRIARSFGGAPVKYQSEEAKYVRNFLKQYGEEFVATIQGPSERGPKVLSGRGRKLQKISEYDSFGYKMQQLETADRMKKSLPTQVVKGVEQETKKADQAIKKTTVATENLNKKIEAPKDINIKTDKANKSLKETEKNVDVVVKKGSLIPQPSGIKTMAGDLGFNSMDEYIRREKEDSSIQSLANNRYTLMLASWQTGMLLRNIGDVVYNTAQAAAQREIGMSGARRSLQLGGYDVGKMTSFAQQYSDQGILSEATAFQGMKLLANKGLSEEIMKNLYSNIIDSAVANRGALEGTLDEVVGRVFEKINANRAYPFAELGMSYDPTYWENKYKQEKGIGRESKLTSRGKTEAQAMALEEMSRGFKGAAMGGIDPFNKAINKLNASFTNIKANLGAGFLPLVIALANAIDKIVAPVSKWISEHSKGVTVFVATASVLLLVANVIASLGSLILAIKPIIIGFAAGFTQLLLRIPAVAAAFAGLGLTVSAVAPWLAAIGVIILALSAAFGTSGLIDDLEDMKSQFAAMNDKIKNFDGTGAGQEISYLTKQIKELNEQLSEAKDSFLFNMTEMVRSHDDNIKKMQKDLKRLAEDMSRTFKDINDDYKENILDMDIDYARKIEDLQRNIREEMSKGLWGDMSKVTDWERELKRAQEDYARSRGKATSGMSKQQSDSLLQYQRQIEDITEEVSNEKRFYDSVKPILDKFNTSIAELRGSPSYNFTEADKAYRAYLQQIADINKQLYDLEKQKSIADAQQSSLIYGAIKLTEKSLVDAISGSRFGTISSQVENINKSGQPGYIYGNTAGITTAAMYYSPSVQPTIQSAQTYGNTSGMSTSALAGYIPASSMSGFTPLPTTTTQKFIDYTVQAGDWLSKIASRFGTTVAKIQQYNGISNPDLISVGQKLKIPQFAQGGVVPGYMGQPVFAMVHGGETVLPAGASPITININNPSVRREQDIKAIADEVRKVMAEYQKYARFK